MLLITRRAGSFAVRYLSPVGLFSCSGGRSEALNQTLLSKTKESWRNVQSVRIDQHGEDRSCWLHTDMCCLSESTAPVHAAYLLAQPGRFAGGADARVARR
jgi:hypothetical protein